MSERIYVGIDSNSEHEWVVALWAAGRMILSQPFRNTPKDLAALVAFIKASCSRPKICLKPTGPYVLKLLKFVGSIPDAEVLIMSEAGFQLQHAWISKSPETASVVEKSGHAALLACCAKRMI